MPLNLASFGRWTLRDKAAQRRLALRWAYTMRRIFIVATVLGFFLPPTAHAQRGVTLFGQGDTQTMYRWSVPWSQFVTQPRWVPAMGNPPLAISKAAEIAETWIKTKNPEVKSFAISSIDLVVKHEREDKAEDRWYYKIEFQPIVGGQRLFGGQFIAVVLFDGTVVEPQLERTVRP